MAGSMQGGMIYQDKNSGIIITGNSLAVQNIQRHNEGDYSCLASNDVGTTHSQSINLNIKCKKYCFLSRKPSDSTFIFQ